MNDHYLSRLAEKVKEHYLAQLTDALTAARAEIAAFREAARHSAERHAELDDISDELILCRADLNAARAENKRLLQKIEALVHVWDSNTRDYRMPLAVSNLRALLQSEKGGE